MPRIPMERSGEMEIFARVVQEGSLSRAARSLDLTPSGVSKLLSRLEGRLGARLLLRTTRAVTLTDEGEAYYRAALAILRDLDDAEHAASGGAVRGRLRVSASLPFGTLFVAPAVPEFLARNPGLSIDLSLSDTIVDLLAERVDVAIRVGDLPDSALVARRLATTRRVVCASPAYLARRGTPATPADLAGHDCLCFTFRPSPGFWPFQIDGQAVQVPVTGGLRIDNGETARQMALLGAGIARLGRFHVAADLAAGRLVALLEDHNGGDIETIHALHVGGGPVPHRVRAFVDFLAERVRGTLDSLT